MEYSGTGKSPNTSLSFRYNANNEELEELSAACEDDPPTPIDASPMRSESASPKKGDKTPSILDKYFKSMRVSEKTISEKDEKPIEGKVTDTNRSPAKEVSSSPVKDYLKNLGKRSISESTDVKDVGNNETWKLFHDFKLKIAQTVEDIKTRSLEETKDKEKSMPRDNSISDSEENSVLKDSDQSVGDTDNQVSSLNSSMQNLSENTQALTAKASEQDLSLPYDKNDSEASDDTQKNLVHTEMADDSIHISFDDSPHMEPSIEVESGIEALEDNLDALSDSKDITFECLNKATLERPITFSITPPLLPNFNQSAVLIKNQERIENREPLPFFSMTLNVLTAIVILNFTLFPTFCSWNAFLFGIWLFYVCSKVKEWVLDNFFGEGDSSRYPYQLNKNSNVTMTYTIPSVKEHSPMKKYEGWINQYRSSEYDPMTYSVNKTTTAFMKLEGSNLRISYTKGKIPKRALWDEKLEKMDFYQHRIYNLTGAKVELLPKGLARRRLWSKKYPINIILKESEKFKVLEKELEKKVNEGLEKKKEQHETECAETNTSPEKKKFGWRRKEKGSTPYSSAHTESDPGKEGLRHRLARKKHKDKKPESPTVENEDVPQPPAGAGGAVGAAEREEQAFHDAEAEPASKQDDDADDEREELVDDNESEAPTVEGERASASEGEWREAHDRQLFLFTRTGRDKLEWYRRLAAAIEECSTPQSGENSSASEEPQDHKEGPPGESVVYKPSDKDNVAITNLRPSTVPEKNGEEPIFRTCEKTFWPFFIKILEQKNSKKVECECSELPAEVAWMNAVLARIVYDFMHNQSMMARLQARIQRKLATLKLPSFMSPLVVTELSLAGACPLVARVSGPTWDERGVWLDADLRYEGGACISILTQINLLKLKEKNLTAEDLLLDPESPNYDLAEDKAIRRFKPAVYDSDVEDTAESSDDDSSPLQPTDSFDNLSTSVDTPAQTSATDLIAGTSSKKKFLRMVDKIATNKYFQQVSDYKFVKRAMEGLSNTDIKLQLEIQALEGRLAINLPPPPHDRVWFGFRTNPQLVLRARPGVGARTLRFTHVSNWIEQRLGKEFEKLLVLPNMEDVQIDLLAPTPLHCE